MNVRKRSGLWLAAIAGLGMCCAAAQGQVVISQVYGGASSSGSTYQRDFIELYNRGSTPVNLSTWSVQYASATGTSWSKTNLTGTIQPGGYFLVAETSGTSGVALPTPDVTGTIDLSSTQGKVALVANQTTLPAQYYPALGSGGVVDFVGYGVKSTTSTGTGPNAYEGSGPTGTNISTTLAAVRKDAGCTDTQDNSADFITATPAAHNSASPTNSCASIPATGGCCLSTGTCQNLTAAGCATAGGTYAGDFNACVAGTYTVTHNPATLIDISGTGTDAAITGDDSSGAVQTLPFTFYWYGAPASNYKINTNGWVSLQINDGVSSGTNAYSNFAFNTTTQTLPNIRISPYWDDQNVSGTAPHKIYTQTIGTAPNRQFIVQWNQNQSTSITGSGTDSNTYEVIFNEGSNVLEFRYGPVVAQGATYAGGTSVASFNAGVKDLSGTLGIDVTSSVGTGGDAAASQFTPTGECPSTGACCNAGACTLATVISCPGSGGVFSGAGTSCSPSPCAIGACCLPSGSCGAGQTSGQCATNAGIYQGDNSACGGTPCPPVGNCCVGTTCSVGFQTTCTGVWTSGGTCTTNVCATPCCDPSTAACTLIATNGGTCSGTLGTAGVTCTPTNPCPAGACCNPGTGICSVVGPSGCAFTYSGNGTTCSTNPCPAPANDLCASAIALPGSGPFPLQVLGQNASATDTSAFTPAVCVSSSHDVWYTFTPANGSLAYSFTLCNTVTGTLDTVMSIHSACPTGSSNNLDTTVSTNCNDDGCSGSAGPSAIGGLTLTAGRTYYIRVARWSTGSGGPFRLDVTTEPFGACCTSAAACSLNTQSACTATSGNVFIGGGTLCSTSGICNGACCDAASGSCTFTTAASCTGVHGGIGSACTTTFCPSSTCCNDASGACTVTGTAACPSGTTPNAAATCSPVPCTTSTCCNNSTGACTTTGTAACPAGTTPKPAATCSPTPCTSVACCDAFGACTVTGTDPCPSGSTATASSTCSPIPCPPPSNDLCSAPIVLSQGTPYVGSNASATGDTTEGPAPSCQSSFSHSVWFTFTAPATTSYHVSTCGTLFDDVLTVFSGTCGAPVEIACDDDACAGSETSPGPGPGSTLASDIASVAMTGGQTYIIRLSGYSSNSGVYGIVVQYLASNPVGSCCNGSSCSLTDATNCASGGTFTVGGACGPSTCAPAGVCCRGATCNASVLAPACTSSGTAGAAFTVTASGCNATPTSNAPCCFADYNKTGGVGIQDIFDFLTDWFNGNPYANTGGNGAPAALTIQNIFDFLTAWFAGGC